MLQQFSTKIFGIWSIVFVIFNTSSLQQLLLLYELSSVLLLILIGVVGTDVSMLGGEAFFSQGPMFWQTGTC